MFSLFHFRNDLSFLPVLLMRARALHLPMRIPSEACANGGSVRVWKAARVWLVPDLFGGCFVLACMFNEVQFRSLGYYIRSKPAEKSSMTAPYFTNSRDSNMAWHPVDEKPRIIDAYAGRYCWPSWRCISAGMENCLMGGIVFKFFGIATLIIIVVYMAASAFRRARRLDARIREFRKEQDELTRSGRAQDPYAALAEIYAEEEKRAGKGSRRHGRKRG